MDNIEPTATDVTTNAPTSSKPNPLKRYGAGGALVAGGLVAGGLLAGTLSANADTNTPDATTPPSSGYNQAVPSDGTVDQSQPQRSDEELLTGTTADKVTAAALAAYPGATIQRVETDSDGVYEAHIITADGEWVIVQVGADFTVTGTQTGGPGGGHGSGAPPGDAANPGYSSGSSGESGFDSDGSADSSTESATA